MTKIFKETNYYIIPESQVFNEPDNYLEICPKCNYYLTKSIIPCPDNFGKSCRSEHKGFRCMSCNSYFQKVEDCSEF